MRGVPVAVGWPGVVAALALTAAALLATVLTPHWQRQTAALRGALPKPAATAGAAPPAALPAAGDPAERVADLLALALRHGVTVDRVQQRLDNAGAVQRLQLGLAARGRYVDLRAFVGEALRVDPALALDRVALRRGSAATADLEADLQWSLLRPTPSSGRIQ